MKKQLLRALVLGTTCCVISAQAQTPDYRAGSSTGKPQDSNAPPSQKHPGISSEHSAGRYGAAGRMGQPVRASQLEGALVSSPSGQNLGTLKDAIVNPSSGHIDFAILTLSAGANATETTPGAPGAGAPRNEFAAGGKEVVVPWMMLRTYPGAGLSKGAPGNLGAVSDKMRFVFSGDVTKLQNAPAFDDSTDLSQPEWRQNIYSHYGLTSGAAIGGGTYSPGGSTSGGGTDRDDPRDHSANGSPSKDKTPK